FLSFSEIAPVLLICTIGRFSAVSRVSVVLGTSISMPNSITCAVSMKMISNTRTTSTRGTILISESVPFEPPKRRRPIPESLPSENAIPYILTLALQISLRQVQELEREIFHPGSHLFDSMAEVVVGHRGRNRRRETQSRRQQRIRNAGSDRAHTCRSAQRKHLKRLDNPEHGAEQADKRRDRCGGREPVHVALQPRNLFAHAELQSPFDRHHVADPRTRLNLARDFAIAKIEDRG